MEWSKEDTFKVIMLYQQFPCLWDLQCPFYKRVDKKKEAWEEISKIMEKDKDTVKKKIKNLRSAYLFEKKKVDSIKKESGSSAEEIYRPHLYYYNEMTFLEPSVTPRKTSSVLDFSNEDSEFIKYSPTLNPEEDPSLNINYMCSERGDTPVKRRNLKRKAKRDEKINSALDAIIAQISEETMFSSFGKSVGMQLEKMPLNTAMEAMTAIQKILTGAMQSNKFLVNIVARKNH